MFKMGYEIFSNCAKLSSTLVPRINSDRSLIVKGANKTPLENHSFHPVQIGLTDEGFYQSIKIFTSDLTLD